MVLLLHILGRVGIIGFRYKSRGCCGITICTFFLLQLDGLQFSPPGDARFLPARIAARGTDATALGGGDIWEENPPLGRSFLLWNAPHDRCFWNPGFRLLGRSSGEQEEPPKINAGASILAVPLQQFLQTFLPFCRPLFAVLPDRLRLGRTAICCSKEPSRERLRVS